MTRQGYKDNGRPKVSQSAFVRGFIDDRRRRPVAWTCVPRSQSAFVRGFIDDNWHTWVEPRAMVVSIRVRARLHR